MQKGTISVQTENIFPIIKKFLYSDQEIFLRELIANATDATSKLRTLSSRGEVEGELGDLTIDVILDKEANTLTIKDRGIGMSEEEVQKYLNQVAFSSAQEFLEKYKDESNIIGHFGLGFYSAFMVADKVEVHTKSYKGTDAVQWHCEGNPEYEIGAIEKEERGTEIILHLSEDAKEFGEEKRIQELLDKYCKFLPFMIRFGTKSESYTEGEGEDAETKTREVDNFVNNPSPAWKKQPSELTDEDYKNFYQELYPHSQPPLFWIHLNIDYPFNLTGILYFPKMSNSMEVQKNKIHLYSNQVYVTDDVKEIVPEFLTLLHGVIDSPDIPLNVSRSYLQSDFNVKKITEYITKKVADKLDELFRKERESFTDKWDSMNVFVKYGMLTEEKFFEKAKKFCLFENVDNQYFTFEEYREKIAAVQTDKNDTVVHLYTNDPVAHDSFINTAKENGYDVLKVDQVIDNHFIQKLETSLEKVSFKRVDADTLDQLIDKDETKESVLSETEQEKVKTLFEGQVNNPQNTVQLKPLSPNDQPVTITKPEFMRRMKEMQMMQGMGDMPDYVNVIVNTNHPIIASKLLKMRKDEKKEALVKHLYNLALLHQGMLVGTDLTNFIKSSIEMID